MGPAGPKGETGATGATGATGTANVIYSDWFTPASYTKDTVFGTYGFYYDKAASAITQQVLDSGTVLTFGKLNGYNTLIWPTAQVSQLPIVVTYQIGGTVYNDTWSALITPGNLRVQFIDDKNFYNGISNTHKFRYIVIPGGVHASSSSPTLQNGHSSPVQGASVEGAASRQRPDYAHMPYAELCQRLGIPQ